MRFVTRPSRRRARITPWPHRGRPTTPRRPAVPGGGRRACGRGSPCSAPHWSRWSARCCSGSGGCSSAGWPPGTGAAPRQHGAGRRARPAGRAGQRGGRGGAAGGGAARRPDRVPARGDRRGRSCPGGWSGGFSGRCTRSPRRPGGCRRSRSTPALGLRDARGEVAELAAGFDAMLDRLQAAFDAQRRFVANASHELRTPLAVLRTEVDVTLADPDADVAELRRMGEIVREATRRADELIAGLLLLARSEAPSAVDPAAVRAGGPRRGRRARPRRHPRRGDPAGLRVQRAPRARPDRRRPGAARAGGRQPRRERRAAQRARPAGWR